MSECCVTTSPKIVIKPNSCSNNTVQASRPDSSVGIGCVPSVPRDLIGDGLLVTMYYYDATVGQVVFQGPDRNSNTLQNASKESSLVLVNGVVLDNDQYQLTEVTLTLHEGCLTDSDIVSVIVFREPNEADQVATGQVTTVDVLTVPPGSDATRPINLPDNLELITTQFDANWFLNDRIEDLESSIDDIDLSEYSTTVEMVAADDTTLADAKAYTDSEIAAIPPAGNVDLSDYALTAYVNDEDSKLQIQIDSLSASGGYNDSWISPAIDAGDASTLTEANTYTDSAVAGIAPPAPPDLSTYETIAKSESDDAALQSQIDALSSGGGYNDAWIQDSIDAGDASTLSEANTYTDSLFGNVTHPDPPDLSPYETIVKSSADDAATLTSAKSYTDQKFNAVVHPSPTIVSATEPSTKTDGTNWFDTVRLELFVRASSSWLPSSPLGARVTQGEIVQAQIIEEVGRKVGVSGQNEVDTTFRIKSDSKTFISAAGNELGLYNLRTPTDDSHAVNLGYANEHYQRSQKPIGFKIDQSAVCSLSTIPRSGEFCGLNNSSPGSSTSANNYFGNFNAGIRVHIDKLKNPLGETFAPNERYNIAGTVTIFGKTSGKLFFRHGITMVSRDTSHDYVTLTFATRVPTFGTGAINAEDESKYIVIVDGLTAAATSTTLIPEGEPTDE